MPVTVEQWSDARMMPGLCLVKPQDKPGVSDGGIIYSDKTDLRHEVGLVVNIAEGDTTEFEVHDWVVFDRMSGGEFETTDKQTVILMKQDDILAVVG
jgi:co-chaperonin GroES (HSP10)